MKLQSGAEISYDKLLIAANNLKKDDEHSDLKELLSLKPGVNAVSTMFEEKAKPDVTLAREAGLEIDANGGIKVNPFMQTSDANVFAAGELASCPLFFAGKRASLGDDAPS